MTDGRSGARRETSEPVNSKRVWFALGAFIALTATLALRHEMWRDEVRALSVATQAASWGQLLGDLHHEGHPLLWYAILRAGYAVTHSPLVLPVAALAISAVTAYLILRYAPFPFWTRLLAVFGAFLGFELTVMARNYGIGVLLMICASVVYPSRERRPLFFALFLALLANTSVHAALATLILLCVWLVDLMEPATRRALLRPDGIVAIAVVVTGAVIAFETALPSADMAWAFSLDMLRGERVARSVFMDPGWSLRGVQGSNIAAAGELPWRLLGIDPELASRVIVDICLLALAWSLRRSRAALAGLILTVIGFELLFRNVWSGALRHQGLILFLLFSICWMGVKRNAADAHLNSRRIAFGLLPLLLFQALALPVMAQRFFRHPESASREFAAFIRSDPRYRDAILASEPDYFMESMPYYVGNRIFMPRQREFNYRVYFDAGRRRKQDLTLGGLIDIADSVACTTRQPVLLAMGHPNVAKQDSGQASLAYKGAVFRWTAVERTRLAERGKPVASFLGAASDELYDVFEIAPEVCGRR